ncbi:MAG: hypothetical protein ACLGIS_17870 [Actinomycetes bacterium]
MLRLTQERPVEDAFRAGVAAGSATAMTPTTDLCHRRDVERLESETLQWQRSRPNTSAWAPPP